MVFFLVSDLSLRIWVRVEEEKEEEEENITAPSEDKQTTTTTTTTTTKKKKKKKKKKKNASTKLDTEKQLMFLNRSEKVSKRKREQYKKKKEEKRKKKTKEKGVNQNERKEEGEQRRDGGGLEQLKKTQAYKNVRLPSRALRRILKQNGHAGIGHEKREVLVWKYLDGQKNGGLSRCSKCNQLGLSMNYDESGFTEVRCPGHYDSKKFHSCDNVSLLTNLNRSTWKEGEEEETTTEKTEETQPREVSLSDKELEDLNVLQNKYNRQNIKEEEDLLSFICTLMKSKGLIVGGDKIAFGFNIRAIIAAHTKRGCVSLQPVVEDIFKKYPKTSIEVKNPANIALFNFLSALQAHATAEAIDSKDIAIITKNLMVIKKFVYHVKTVEMVEAMWKGSASVDGVEVKKQSTFSKANAELIKFWITNQKKDQNALIKEALQVLQNAKAQAQAKSKKSPKKKKRKSKTSPSKPSPKKVTTKLKVSPSQKKQKTNS